MAQTGHTQHRTMSNANSVTYNGHTSLFHSQYTASEVASCTSVEYRPHYFIFNLSTPDNKSTYRVFPVLSVVRVGTFGDRHFFLTRIKSRDQSL